MNDDQALTPAQQKVVAQRAYAIWLAEGCPDGRDEMHWHQAKSEMFGPDADITAGSARNASDAGPDAPVKKRARKTTA